MQSDILVHLAPCDIGVTWVGEVFVIPARTAYEWAQLLLASPFDPYDVFPGLAGPAAVVAVEDALGSGKATDDDLSRAALEVISAAGDRPWWVTVRVLACAGTCWDRIGGTLVREGVDARRITLAAWMDAIWMIMKTYVDPKKLAAWTHQVEEAPKGWAQEIDLDENERAFMAAMASAR